MKAKLILPLIAISLILFAVFKSGEEATDEITLPSKSMAKFVKCTSANFLLTNVDTTKQISPLFENMGNLEHRISTNDERAQAFFNQGLRLTYAFNHAEAHRSFMEASRLDKDAPMTYWGQAYALAPNINDPFPDEQRRKAAYEASLKAKAAASQGSEKEKDLIDALLVLNKDVSMDLDDLNDAHMKAMENLATKYPDDADIQTLYAASVMNTMPWNYWDNDGNPAPNTLKAKAALERAMEINPDHPGAHHYYIHMVELPKPDLAVPSAERLGNLMPAAGHLVHMPSHIFIRVGRYEEAVKANQMAIEADEDYISQCYSQGMYPLGYYPHNIHFLWSAASLLGDSRTAIDAAKKTAEKVPLGELENLPFLQDFASTPLLAYTRFGKWNEILTVPYPGDKYKHLKMIWHYARGIAFLRKDNIVEAEEELEALKAMELDKELETIIANYTNPTSEIAKVARAVLEGEVAHAKGNTDEAIKHLKEAVENEDNLIYSEPSPWHIPARQTLGMVLLDAGKYVEAEEVYRKDLEHTRQNGWSLYGLHQSLNKQGKTDEANKIKKEFDKAWGKSDVTITASVL